MSAHLKALVCQADCTWAATLAVYDDDDLVGWYCPVHGLRKVRQLNSKPSLTESLLSAEEYGQ